MAALEMILGLVGGAITGAGTVGVAALNGRHKREARFYEQYDRRMSDLEAKVKECEAERPVLAILRLGMCMAVPEIQRLSRRLGEPSNPVLSQVASAFQALPVEHHDLSDLLDQLRTVPGVYTPPEGDSHGS